MFEKLDTYLLAKAQKLTDLAQRTIGITKFTFEKWMIICYTAFHTLFCLACEMPMLMVLIVFMACYAVTTVRAIEKQEASFLQSGLIKPGDVTSDNMRILAVSTNGITIVIILTFITVTLLSNGTSFFVGYLTR